MISRYGSRLRRMCTLLAVLSMLTLSAGSAVAGGQEIERQRERWNKMSETTRELLRRRYGLLKEMNPEERAFLVERWRRWRDLEPYLRRTLPRDRRERLDAMDGFGERQGWMEAARDYLRTNGRRMRAALPRSLRGKLRDASVEEMRAYMQGVHQRREFHGDRALLRLGKRLGYSPEEVEDFRSKGVEEKLGLVLQLRRRVIQQEMEARFERGLRPAGMDRERWEQLKAAPDDEFFRSMRALRGPGPDGRARITPHEPPPFPRTRG